MLKAEVFKTMDRAETRFIAVRDTLTLPDPSIDAYEIDRKCSRQGRLGIGVHFLINMDGDVQLARPVETVGSHSRNYDNVSVAVGVVGGLNEDGDREYTRSPEQEEVLSDLVTFLRSIYPEAEPHDLPQVNTAPS